ncbi:hypothetical protein GUJ93_ZPchr0054g2840 [Zizania palustris]|uniref:VQ domain-containing protein n=1 Tax=Zizania palustris TaxID=103762 RepID=A0A8J5QW09_ZIZPA|nr:hypothetical protein GUJ93_ZPchr0054g2840 [Zizania palustris]
MDRKQYGSKGGGNNAHRPTATADSSGRQHEGKSDVGEGRAGKKKRRAIKVVHISNPMRVTTSAEGFRALVQELTGRHADPSKYAGGGGGGGESGGGSGIPPVADQLMQGQGAALHSPGSTAETSSSSEVAGAGQVHTAAYDDGYNGDDSFAPQLIDNRYSVCFSPPTLFYDAHTYDDDN